MLIILPPKPHARRSLHLDVGPADAAVAPDPTQEGEGHGFHKKEDQRDVLERPLAWFGKYLAPGAADSVTAGAAASGGPGRTP